MKFLQGIWFFFLFTIACLWIGGYLYYVKGVKDYPLQAEQQADAIVVLTGTPARLTKGFDLLKNDLGKRLLISGVNAGVSTNTLRLAMGESDEIMQCCVDIGRKALDTVGNANEVVLWAIENEFEDIYVVTSGYHMPRSLVELRRVLPEASLRPIAVEEGLVDLENWWKNPKSMYILAAEFNKYLFSLIRARTEAAVMSGDTT